MVRDSLFTIAPHAPFLTTLCDRVLDGTLLGDWPREGAFWLSDVTIILPTRRARLQLAAEFASRLGGVALLPDIRTFGGEVADEEPFLPPYDLPAPMPVASPLERRLTLSALVRAFALSADGFASPPNAAEILWLADSLGTVIDDLTIEAVDPQKLRELVPDELAANWQQILKFLEIVLTAWPATLAERGKVDAAAARNQRLARQAEAAPRLYGDRPVIAAGSTGSIPATGDLLKAIAALPRGVLVLPGLDTTLTAAQHEALLAGETAQGHPQFVLMQLLRRLGAGVAEVQDLAGDPADPAFARTALVRAALAPADETASWAARRRDLPVDTALEGVTVLAAPNADIEARAIALAARAALVERRTVGIVSRDQNLARRIAVELKRHGIIVDDAVGTPLYQAAAGRLARQVLAVAEGNYAPVDIVALLRGAAVTLGGERSPVWRLADALDIRLRAERPLPGLDGLKQLVASEPELTELLDRLGAALAPVFALMARAEISAAELATALGTSLAALTGGASLPGGEEFARWVADIASHPPGATFRPALLDSVLAALLAGSNAQPVPTVRDDIHIWGELEARLQSPDLLILAGLNEDIWPPIADPGPWLSRKMRIEIGLAPPERRQGQASHDFAMAMGNAEVLLAYAARLGTSPALPSPLLQRLDAFIGTEAAKTLRQRGAIWLHQAQAIDFAGPPQPAPRPAPRPTAAQRPRRLSITDIEPLMRSPYDIYAKYVLRLRPLDPLGADPSARERGTMIHHVFETFIEKGHDFTAADAHDHLMQFARDEFEGLEAIGERRDIWLRRFEHAAMQILHYERDRDPLVRQRFAEKKGEWAFPALEGFVLSGKADRLDLLTDGTLEIIDFKTGGVPAPGEMRGFEAPQLLLEAAMAHAGRFPDVPAVTSSALTYLKIGLGPAALELKPFKLPPGMTLPEAVDEIVRRLQRHVQAFLIRDDLPMVPDIKPRPASSRRFRRDYEHLARTDEWVLTSGVDE